MDCRDPSAGRVAVFSGPAGTFVPSGANTLAGPGSKGAKMPHRLPHPSAPAPSPARQIGLLRGQLAQLPALSAAKSGAWPLFPGPNHLLGLSFPPQPKLAAATLRVPAHTNGLMSGLVGPLQTAIL